ncbi:MAG: class I SAM-dependent methyltransferase [Bacteroidetes bacterium]|nr:class I SAM-dependent methyltransferase [Bacteroidota bacterium]
MINTEDYSTGLIDRDGILFSRDAGEVSYPVNGNESCFQIEDTSFWFKHRNNCITEAVTKYCHSGIFFDIGGGNGFVAQGLENKGILTVIVEPGIQGCLNARKRNLKNIICSTLENVSFKKNTIPAIGLFDVLEHIENDVGYLATIYNLLVEDGLVFITVPAYRTLWSAKDVEAGHFRRYTRKELEEKLKAIGFNIEYSTYIFSVLAVAVFLFRSLPGRFGFIKNSNSLDKKEHQSKKGFINNILSRIWKKEIQNIRNGRKIPFGGSCFFVARKQSV